MTASIIVIVAAALVGAFVVGAIFGRKWARDGILGVDGFVESIKKWLGVR